MSSKLTAITLVLISMSATQTRADDVEKSMFSFKGFGTLGVVHSSEDGADFKGSVYQPNGAGHTHGGLYPGVDSVLGAQVRANLTDKFSAIVQAVSQHQFDNSYRPLIEWANIKYQATPDLSIRAGRIVLSSFLVSESRFVGYANPWIRPPQELYFVSSITSSDGIDVTYSSQFSGFANTIQGSYGSSYPKLATGKLKSKPVWAINDSITKDALTLRAAYIHLDLDFDLGSIDPLINGFNTLGGYLNQFGYTQAGAQSLALADKYKLTGLKLNIYTVGANYDPGDWFVMGELAKFAGDGLLQDSKSGYITAGYRIEKFTPYATYGQIKTDRVIEDGITTTGLPGAFASGANSLSAGINTTLKNFANSQKSFSVGLRWDFARSADLKIQYDRLSLEDGTNGKLTNPVPNFSGDKANVFSAAVDFVF